MSMLMGRGLPFGHADPKGGGLACKWGCFRGVMARYGLYSVQEVPLKKCVTIVNGDTVARRARKWP